MNINERVCKAVFWFEQQTGQSPTKLYVGKKEDEELKQEWDQLARQGLTFRLTAAELTEEKRRRYQGLLVYVVDDPNYLDCGL